MDNEFTSPTFFPCAINYICLSQCNFSSGNYHQYNMLGVPEEAGQKLGTTPVNSLFLMKYSNALGNIQPAGDMEVFESTRSSRKKSATFPSHEDFMSSPSPPLPGQAGSYAGACLGGNGEFLAISEPERQLAIGAKTGSSTSVISNKINLLRKVLEGITDETQVLITAKPKNKSQKIRKSNRHSRFRGVSLNGKKWQVMIMGPMKKKYFGGITSEREAAVFYDKLSILTNGLAAKTNFNYRKSDLVKIMAELEYMEPYISN